MIWGRNKGIASRTDCRKDISRIQLRVEAVLDHFQTHHGIELSEFLDQVIVCRALGELNVWIGSSGNNDTRRGWINSNNFEAHLSEHIRCCTRSTADVYNSRSRFEPSNYSLPQRRPEVGIRPTRLWRVVAVSRGYICHASPIMPRNSPHPLLALGKGNWGNATRQMSKSLYQMVNMPYLVDHSPDA